MIVGRKPNHSDHDQALTSLFETARAHQRGSKGQSTFHLAPRTSICFTQMKQEIVSAPILAYYNPKNQTFLQTDASIKGLGTHLLQEGKQFTSPAKL